MTVSSGTGSATKMKLKPPSSTATLHTLYHRAARAFLLRQVPLVHSLLESAFALLHPPERFEQHPDTLAPYRNKWDVLRITLETTIYTSPPADIPDPLRDLLAQPPAALISAAYRRSLALFTPRSASQKASCIPSAVILTLVYSSLKLEAPDAGRVIVEDWLASRDPSVKEEDPNYRKAVEAYCLYVLPKLEQWEYATEFLDYESELTPDTRELQNLAASPARPGNRSSPPARRPTISVSPTTACLFPRPVFLVVLLFPFLYYLDAHRRPRHTAPPRTTSSSSASTATPRAALSSLPSASASSPPRPRPHSHSHPSPTHLPRLHPGPTRAPTSPTTYALLNAALAPYLTSKTKLAAAALSLLTFVLLVLVRRRRSASLPASLTGAGTPSKIGGGDIPHVELVRRRLAAASAASGVGGGAGVLARAVAAVLRVVGDTVRMGGSGLV
ncbi:hypothetical protein K438DRAFT_1773877 [Mycena galopus ATCC 62051]|nr:hypothetical protein K438DRAFT_1773877 [Mycena galopus ATCC 62051]